MDRPTVLLAVASDPTPYIDALRRAGFEPTFDTGRPDLAVLDCDLPVPQLNEIYAALHAERATPTLLVVGEDSPLPERVGDGSHDEVALAPMLPDALVYRLQALMIRAGRQLPTESGAWADESISQAPLAGEGHVVSVFAPKGGVGKTTVAVNVAVALRAQTRSEVLLFDADVGVGNVTSVLDVPYRMGLADLADSDPSEWTDAAFDHVATTHQPTGVRVLTWGTDPAQSERVSVDLLLAALRWGRNHHSFVIVDNHPGYDDRTMAMLATSSEIMLVVTPEVGAVRNSSQFLELAREVGLGSVVRVVVNRANHGIRVADMASSLGLPISATVVSNGPKAVIASNEGIPVVTKFPKERIADDLHRVARLISQPEVETPPEVRASRPWWARIGTRTSNA